MKEMEENKQDVSVVTITQRCFYLETADKWLLSFN